MTVRVPPVSAMGDDTLVKHFEMRHGNDLADGSFVKDPHHDTYLMREPSLWRTYHATVHRLHANTYDHEHNEE